MQTFHVVGALALSCVFVVGDASATDVQSPVSGTFDARTRCGAKQPDALEQELIEAQIAALEGSASFAGGSSERVVIPVHFHVITTSSGDGNVSGLVPAQMDVLNAAFAASGFEFTLASQEVVANNRWFFERWARPKKSR